MVTGVDAGIVLAGAGVGFPVAAAVGVTLVVAATLVAVQALRPPPTPVVAGGCLVGVVGTLAQLALTAGDPASRVAYLSGLLGASAWYGVGVRLLADRVTGAGRQWLAVGSLLWVGGTVTVTTAAAPADWPLVWGLLAGLGVLGVSALLWLTQSDGREREWTAGLHRETAILSGAFLAPATLGLLAGEEVLFLSYVLVFAVAVVTWSLARLALGG